MLEIKDVEKIINEEGFVVSKIKGISMLPFLKQKDDSIVITKVDRPIKLYDVVLYKNSSGYVLHRVIDNKGNVLKIKGDNTLSDEEIDTNNILGILKAKYNKKGYIELDDEINRKYYELSNKHKLFKRIRNGILRRL